VSVSKLTDRYLLPCIRTVLLSKSVYLSVGLSNACTAIKRERNLCPHFYTIWKIDHPSFPTRRMVGWEWPVVPEIIGQTDSVPAKRRFSIDLFCSKRLSRNAQRKKFN